MIQQVYVFLLILKINEKNFYLFFRIYFVFHFIFKNHF